MFARSFAAAALAAAAMAAPTAVLAQNAPVQRPGALIAQAPAAQPQAPQPSAEQVALARQVVELSGASTSFENVIPAFIEQAKAMFLPTNPDLGRQFNEVGEQLKTEFQPRVNELIQSISVAYAQRFTLDELKRILAFYQSAEGQKLVRTVPSIMEETFARSQQWSQVVTRDLVQRFREEFQKRGIRL
ncbi:DUF2059 domain-containing protein [Phreatobacter sp. AB_2022a]|uniref:DUF2059 domain-containing protein n=1 Tax=Phreatobacter sp. AB_2022a TaxID=3003134 RepID=UPI000579B6A2|nr:DUF2059 domain-containing protein [Phreatobacter sp. AB_2022a]MCZ0735772.1 DUF2059 domain-containing protein [Phreatobacter sp. AB_2022a]CEJ15679.1 hypothetical protein BN1110_06026 [bacterium YEK0313]